MDNSFSISSSCSSSGTYSGRRSSTCNRILRVIVGSISVRDFVSFFSFADKTGIYAKHQLQKNSNDDFQCHTGWLPKGNYEFISN